MSGQAGTGGSPECQTAIDCPPTMQTCLSATCVDGDCIVVNDPPGTPVAAQIPGDCRRDVCDGNGSTITINDEADLQDDNRDCTQDLCSAGIPLHPWQTQGTPCAESGGNVCNAWGHCVECNLGSDCPSAVCQDSVCRIAECGNGSKDGTETDVDCGGMCGGCSDGQTCLLDVDCQSNMCNVQTCAVATCHDGVHNGMETDIDCGSVCPVACGDGQGCFVDADCLNGSCTLNSLSCATCSDGLKNALETDVDCGGNCPNDCADGQSCLVDDDCVNRMCHANQCRAGVNECNVATATDLTAVSNPVVTFQLFYYFPKCIKVKLGTVLTFSGNFIESPLQGGVIVGGSAMPASSGPFVPVTNSGSSNDFTMTSVGTFPYYCAMHGTFGMRGAVFVVP